MKRYTGLQYGAGAVLSVLGATVGLGWLVQSPLLALLTPPGQVAMVTNTALAFLLSGLALLAPLCGRSVGTGLRTVAGLGLTLGAGAVLGETVFDRDWGLDWTDAHRWLTDGNPRPGRMAPNTCAGFLLAGLIFLLGERGHARRRVLAIQVATFLLLLIGVTGFVGYWLRLDVLYSWLATTRMALPTALGMVMLATGIWAGWYQSLWVQYPGFRQDQKISIISAAILCLATLTGGLASFALLQKQVEASLAQALNQTLSLRVNQFQETLDTGIGDVARLVRRPDLVRLAAQADTPAGRAGLDALFAVALANGDLGLALSTPDGRVRLAAGRLAERPDIAAPLQGPVPARLLWQERFLLSVSAPVRDARGTVLAVLRVDRPLPTLHRLFNRVTGFGATGETGLCLPASATRLRCFPQYQRPRVYETSRWTRERQPTPMQLALGGQSGAYTGLDYRGHPVIAAYAAVNGGSLGMVLKQDAAEVYRPIARQLQRVLPLLAVLIGIGLWLLRAQVRPLTRQLVLSEREARFASERLQEEGRRIRTVVDNIGEGLITLDAHGLIQSFNPAATAIFGYSARDILGQSVTLLTPTLRQPLAEQRALTPEQAHAQDRIGLELPALRKDGVVIQVELTLNRVEQGGRALFIAIVRDITTRLRTVRELNQAKETAEAASRAKSEFLANMSHEIRTPMNGVLGSVGLLLAGELTPEQRELAGLARASGETLLTIINDILDFSKIEAGKLAIEALPFDLLATVEGVAAMLAMQAEEKDLDLVLRFAPSVPRRVIGDPGRIRQILTNLLNNAVKFTEQGHVVVNVEVEARTAQAVSLHVSVRDTGIGIDPVKLPHLFDKFSQADASTTRRYGGTGLGLAICRQLVDMMGGSIGAHSRPGEGSTFWFTLTLPVQDGGEPAAPVVALEGLKVLLVDASPVGRQVLQEQLSAWRVDIQTCVSAQEALRTLHAAHADGRPYPLVILDFRLAGMAGETFIRAIGVDPDLRATRLVVMTTLGQREAVRRLAPAGLAACLVKPVRQAELFDILTSAWSVREAEPVAAPGTPPRFQGRVLLAEDNATNQTVAALMLRQLGCEVDTVATGRDALHQLDQGRYDLVFMDCDMPDMDGFEATAAIRARSDALARMPVIALTAQVMAGDEQRCLRAGMSDYLGKPVSSEAFAAALARWLPGAAPVPGDRPRVSVPLAEAPALDPEALSRLAELAPATMPDFLAQLVRAFEADMDTQLIQLRTALGIGDAAALAHHAHVIQGACAHVGALRMRALALRLEALGRSAAPGTEADGLAVALEAAFAEVRALLDVQAGIQAAPFNHPA